MSTNSKTNYFIRETILLMNTNNLKLKNKKIYSAIAIAAGLVLSPLSASAETPWYVGVAVQSNDLDDVDTVSQQAVGGVNRQLDLSADDETGASLTIGREVFKQANGNTLSLELNYNSSSYDFENIAFMGRDFDASAGQSEGSFDVDTLLARAVYRFELGSFDPFVSLGFGEVDAEADGRYGGSIGQPNQARPPFVTGSDSASAIEFRVGVEYAVNDRFDIVLAYTSTDADDLQFTRRGGGPGGLATTTQEGDVSYDSFSLGAKFSF